MFLAVQDPQRRGRLRHERHDHVDADQRHERGRAAQPAQARERVERADRPAFAGRTRPRFRQHAPYEQEIQRVEQRGRDERRTQMQHAEQPADQRAGDEADAHHRAELAEAPCAVGLGRHVGHVRGRDRDVRAGNPRDQPADVKPRERRPERHQQIVERGAGQRREQHRAAAETVAQRAEQRRAQELRERVQREQDAVVGVGAARGGERAQQPGQDRHHDPDADRVEQDRGQDGNQGRVQEHHSIDDRVHSIPQFPYR